MLQSTNFRFTADDLLYLLVATEHYMSICKAQKQEVLKEIIEAHEKMDRIWLNLPEETDIVIFEEIKEIDG